MNRLKRRYYEQIIRVRRNTGPVGGPWVCEEGSWQEDTVRGKRDRFIVTRTIQTGNKEACRSAARAALQARKDTNMTTTTTKEEVLVYADTRKLVRPGDVVQVRNVSMKVVAIRPPRHEGSSGRVLVQCDGSNADENSEYEYYPSVIGAAWVPAASVPAEPAKKTRMCDICEWDEAEIQVNVTDMEGVVLDTRAYCRECVRGDLASIGLVIGGGEVTNG